MDFRWTVAPAVGETAFAAELTNGVPNALVGLAVGPSRTALGGVPLPAPVQQLFGFGGSCEVMVAPDVFALGQFDGAGVATFPLPIPNDPTLDGLVVYAQGFTLEPGVGWKVVTSNGLGVFIR